MKVCFVVSQLFAWGKYGGFGSMTRTIARELVKRDIEVYAVVPRREDQKSVEELDGITVLSFPPRAILASKKLYQSCDADIYHSEEPTIGTFIAMKAMPSRKHIVTCIDPRDKNDWRVEYSYYSLRRKFLFPFLYLYEMNPLIKSAVKNADSVFCQAKFIIPKARSLYGLEKDLGFLPNPVFVPNYEIEKAENPTVCFLARWDRRKKPEIFFNLAKKFSQVNFIAIGKAHDTYWDDYLRTKYGGIDNLKMVGFIDPFTSDKLQKILEKSWILINTAAREGLPAAFVEAAANKCAILSSVNPDGFSEEFGYYAKNSDFVQGLNYLLDQERWKEKGEKAYEYVKETYELNEVIDKHISIYEGLLEE